MILIFLSVTKSEFGTKDVKRENLGRRLKQMSPRFEVALCCVNYCCVSMMRDIRLSNHYTRPALCGFINLLSETIAEVRGPPTGVKLVHDVLGPMMSNLTPNSI